jgi:hypothetical protein
MVLYTAAMDQDQFDPMTFLLQRPAPRKPPSLPPKPRPEYSDEEINEILGQKYLPVFLDQ